MATTPLPYTLAGTILRAKNVGLSFGDKPVLRNVNFEIRDIERPNMVQGQINALLGPSGVGKTQLFRRMAGLETPGATNTGTVTLGENDVPVRPGLVGVVAQDYPLFMHRTVLGNLVVAGVRAGKKKKEVVEEAKSLLDEFGLSDKVSCWPVQLSGGQRQRVAIAQQVMCSSNIFFMDEPFSGQDPLMIDKTIELLQKVANRTEFNSIILSTHEISAASAIADHITVLGRDRDKSGQVIPGAYVKHEYCLIDMGLAWHEDIRRMPEFREFTSELRELFREL